MRRLAFVICLQFLSLIGCGRQDEYLQSKDSDLDSVVLDAARSKWTNPREIPVCVMNRGALGHELFNDLMDFVKNEYRTKTGIGFSGWGDCTTAQLGISVIRVQFNLKHNWTSSAAVIAGGGLSMVGMSSRTCGTDCVGGTMRLDIGASGNYPADGSRYSSFIKSRTRATAIHEFGHALGLMHEHERTDVIGCDKGDGSVVSGQPYVYVTDYDANSIMNYCHSGSIMTLSDKDVAGINYLYPVLGTGH